MFARNFKNARAAEPELDVKSLAFLGIRTPPDAARRPSSGRFYLLELRFNLLLLKAFDKKRALHDRHVNGLWGIPCHVD
jgi:hypothetical protein